MTPTDTPNASPAAHGIVPGQLVAGKFRIERLIGQGAMGAVFSARHELLEQRVAIKVLLPEIASNGQAVLRFLNEARAASRIEGEHVARVTDVGTLDSGLPYMILEYLEGFDLARLLEKRGPLPPVEAVDYVLQALEAIAQAHALGIVHRDLKPANLFLVHRQDGSTLVKVLDFGISKATQPFGMASDKMTGTNAMLGSPRYMSPEQIRSSKTVDVRTDIWSMGMVLYELLTGEAPYMAESFGELFAAILEQPAALLRSKRPDIDPHLESAVMRCIEREVARRFSTVAQLAQALVEHASPRGRLSLERILAALAPRSSDAPRTSAGHSSPVPVAEQPWVPHASVAPAPPADRLVPWDAESSESEKPPAVASFPAGGSGSGSGATVGAVASTRSSRPATPPALWSRNAAIAVGVGGACMTLALGALGAWRIVGWLHGPADQGAEAVGLAAPPLLPVAAGAPLDTMLPPPLPAAAPLGAALPADAGATATASPKPPVTIQPLPPATGAAPSKPSPAPDTAKAPVETPAPASGCSPNYYFDSKGNKHFKRECFQR